MNIDDFVDDKRPLDGRQIQQGRERERELPLLSVSLLPHSGYGGNGGQDGHWHHGNHTETSRAHLASPRCDRPPVLSDHQVCTRNFFASNLR